MNIISEPSEEDGHISKSLIILAGIVALIFIVSAVSHFFFWRPVPIDTTDKNFSEAAKYAEVHAYDKANEYLKEIVKNTNNTDTKAQAETLIASNNFRTFEAGVQQESIRQLKDIISDQTLSDWRRMLALNALYGFYYFGRNPSVAREIFTNEPYSSYLKDANEDIGLAIRKLAEYSDNIFPNTFAKLRIAFWYGGELLDNKNLTAQTKKEYGEKITSLVKESDTIFLDAVRRDVQLTDIDKALFWHYHALNLAAVSFVGMNKTPNDFEQSFQEVFKLTKPDHGEANLVVRELTAFTHFYYAGFLYEIFGDARLDDIQLHAERAVEIMTSVPDPQNVPFYQFMLTERDKPPKERDHNYRWFVALAFSSSQFAEYLSQNGWKL